MNSGKPLSTAVIGLGQIGMSYDLVDTGDKYIRTHAKAFSSHHNFGLECGVDPSLEQREIFSRIYGCPAYETIEEAINKHAFEVVAIGSPTSTHLTSITKVIQYSKPKAILCEKPLGRSEQEAKTIVQKCSASNIPLYVNYIRRCDPGVMNVKTMIDDGEITLPIRGTIWYSKGFIHNGSHFFNLAEYWLGDTEKFTLVDNGRDLPKVGAEPTVKVQFTKGDVIFIPAWEEHFSHYTTELLSPSGRLYWGKGPIEWQIANKTSETALNKTLSLDAEYIPTDMQHYQWHVVDHLSKALNGEKSAICTGLQAQKTLSSMYEILELRNK